MTKGFRLNSFLYYLIFVVYPLNVFIAYFFDIKSCNEILVNRFFFTKLLIEPYKDIFLKSSLIAMGFNFDYIYAYQNISCPSCSHIDIRNNPSQDLTAGILYDRSNRNALLFVRSLRSTGCRSKIVFFCDLESILGFKHQEKLILQKCGVYLLKIYFQPHLADKRVYKFIPLEIFLQRYWIFFDRILFCDIFDVYFQKDPFSYNIPENKICVSLERTQFKDNSYNRLYVTILERGYDSNFWDQKWVLNSGIILGKVNVFLEFLALQHKDKDTFILSENARMTTDQGSLNQFFYRGNFTNKIWIDFKGELLISIPFTPMDPNIDKNGFIHEYNHIDYTPSIIHLYNHNDLIQCYILKHLCPWRRNIIKENCNNLSQASYPLNWNKSFDIRMSNFANLFARKQN